MNVDGATNKDRKLILVGVFQLRLKSIRSNIETIKTT